MSWSRRFNRKKDYDAQRERMLERREARKKDEEERKLTAELRKDAPKSSNPAVVAAIFGTVFADAMIYKRRPEP